MFFDIIGSGSKGNATLVFSSKTTLLIDIGLPLKRVEPELNRFNKSIKDIDGVVITHNHADHYRDLKSFSPKKQYAYSMLALCLGTSLFGKRKRSKYMTKF